MPVLSASPTAMSALEAARAAGVILREQAPDIFVQTARYLGPYALMLAQGGQATTASDIIAAAKKTDHFLAKLEQHKAQARARIDLDVTYHRFLKPPPTPTEKKKRYRKNDFFRFSQQRWPQAPRCLDALRRGDEKAARKIINRLPEDKRGYLVTKVLGTALDENLPTACGWLIRQNAGDFWHFKDNVKTACGTGRFESVSAILSLFKADSFTRLIDEGYALEWLEASYRNKDARVCDLLIKQFPTKELPAFRLVSGMLEALKHGSEDTACHLIKLAIKRRLKLDQDNAWRLENQILADRAEDFGVLYVRWFKQSFGSAPNDLLGKALEFNCVNIAAAIMDHGGDSCALCEKDHEKLAQFLTCHSAWRAAQARAVPVGFGICDPAFYNPALIEKITTLFDRHEVNVYGWAANVMAFNAAGLFQTPERLGKYMRRWGDPQASQPLHDLIQMIKLPATRNPATDLKAWGDAVIEHGPAMAKLVAFADRVPAPARSADGRSWSLNATRAACAEFAYARGTEHPQLATLCITNGVTEERFDKALDLIKTTKNHASSIPDITLDGADFGLPDCRFYKLANDDIRGLFLGELTGCCQSIGAHGDECASHGFTSPHSGFYVIEDNKGTILGQCWAWRGQAGELCLDSLERLGNHISDEQWLGLLKSFAAELEKQSAHHNVTALHVGLGGKTPKSLSAHFTATAALPRDYNGYRDSHSQIVVTKISAPPARADGRGSRKAGPSGAG